MSENRKKHDAEFRVGALGIVEDTDESITAVVRDLQGFQGSVCCADNFGCHA